MSKIKEIKAYYESNMGEDIPEYRILGWESKDAQDLRFEAFVSNVRLEGRKILDVGCGLGGLLDYLNEINIKVHYTGVDILGSIINHARKKNPDALFYNLDIFRCNPFNKGSFDVVYASGIFNLNLGNNKDFLVRALKLFLKLSGSVVAFNLLHCGSKNKEGRYCYFNPDEVRSMLLEGDFKGIGDTEIIEGYLHNDFTVILRKDNDKQVYSE